MSVTKIVEIATKDREPDDEERIMERNNGVTEMECECGATWSHDDTQCKLPSYKFTSNASLLRQPYGELIEALKFHAGHGNKFAVENVVREMAARLAIPVTELVKKIAKGEWK